MKLLKRLFLLFLFSTIGLNTWMIVSTKSQIYSSFKEVPFNKVGLVLGTSNKNRSGGENKFFKERISTAAGLYNQGKVHKLIVSGSSTQYYNEAEMMQKALIEFGVPKDSILLDSNGSRTLKSIQNCKNEFGLNEFSIITQGFHGYRALFISNYYELDVQVMSTNRLPLSESINVRLREFFARIKAFKDLYLF